MADVIASLLLGLRQLARPKLLRLLLKTAVITLVLSLLAAWGGWHLLNWGMAKAGLSDALFTGAQEARGAVSLILSIIGLWLTWRIVALGVVQFYADEAVQAVEHDAYPHALQTARDLPVIEQLRHAVGSAVRALLINLAVLPFALVLLVTGVGTALLFWAVNAVLLGKELQDMVRLRHCAKLPDASGKLCWVSQAAELSRGQRFLLGGVVAGLLMVPLVNFLAPLLGAAGATHLIHRKGAR